MVWSQKIGCAPPASARTVQCSPSPSPCHGAEMVSLVGPCLTHGLTLGPGCSEAREKRACSSCSRTLLGLGLTLTSRYCKMNRSLLLSDSSLRHHTAPAPRLLRPPVWVGICLGWDLTRRPRCRPGKAWRPRPALRRITQVHPSGHPPGPPRATRRARSPQTRRGSPPRCLPRCPPRRAPIRRRATGASRPRCPRP